MSKYREHKVERPQVVANKIPYVPSQRMGEKMSEAQKEGVRVWNLMRQTLINNGLMEDK